MPPRSNGPAPATQADVRRLTAAIRDLAVAQAAVSVTQAGQTEKLTGLASDLASLKGNLNKIAFGLFGTLLAVAAPLIVKALIG